MFDFLLEQVAKRNPSILAGDFNTGINGIDQKGSSFWYSKYLESLTQAGYVDAFREKQGDTEEYSWYSLNDNGFRYDHIWMQEGLKSMLGDCYYSHQERQASISDHSVMLLELTV